MSIERQAQLSQSLRKGKAGRPPLPAKKIRLILAARDLFYRFGVKAVSLEGVCTAAGVSKPSVYYYFESKDDLVLACVTADADLLCWTLKSALERAGPNLEDRMAGLIAHFATEMRSEHYRGLFISNVALEFPDPTHPVRIAAVRAAQELHVLLTEMVQPAAGDEAAKVGSHLQLLIFGAAAAAASVGGGWVSEALVEAVAQTRQRLTATVR